MARIQEHSLEFARQHIRRFYDTDFFPKHLTFEAIWHNWNDVKAFLLAQNIRNIPVLPPHSLTWPKPRGGYRIVHQLDALSSLLYVALAYDVAPAIEASRAPVDAEVACSYRIAISNGSFFEQGTGYTAFQHRTEELCREFNYILTTDITDFYNQIYVHRVRNAISTANNQLKDCAEEIEGLLMRWNSRTSQGIPVGPSPSIIMSEAVLTDVDDFLKNNGYRHTRYVDDFRIFGNSDLELRTVLRKLTAYLYDVHRLNLSGEKTRCYTTEEFRRETLHNAYEIEKIQIFQGIQEIENPYTNEVEVNYKESGREEAIRDLSALLSRLLALPHVDVGLARAIIRRAKGLKLQEMVQPILTQTAAFLPVVNDIFLFLNEVAMPYPSADMQQELEKLCKSDVGEEPAFRVWAEWLITNSPAFRNSNELLQYVNQGTNYFAQAKIAVMQKNVAWCREKRAQFGHLCLDERLAVIFASHILANDEREPWLSYIKRPASGSTLMEQWFAQSVLDEAFDYSFARDDIEF